jgi:hypothetical protein
MNSTNLVERAPGSTTEGSGFGSSSHPAVCVLFPGAVQSNDAFGFVDDSRGNIEATAVLPPVVGVSAPFVLDGVRKVVRRWK